MTYISSAASPSLKITSPALTVRTEALPLDKMLKSGAPAIQASIRLWQRDRELITLLRG
jgi:hypothetical protein